MFISFLPACLISNWSRTPAPSIDGNKCKTVLVNSILNPVPSSGINLSPWNEIRLMRPKPEARMDNLDEQSLVSRRLTTVLGMEIPLHRYPHRGEAGIPYLGKKSAPGPDGDEHRTQRQPNTDGAEGDDGVLRFDGRWLEAALATAARRRRRRRGRRASDFACCYYRKTLPRPTCFFKKSFPRPSSIVMIWVSSLTYKTTLKSICFYASTLLRWFHMTWH